MVTTPPPFASHMRTILVSFAALAAGCTQALSLSKDDSPTVLSHQVITAPNPGEKGSFVVKTLYYGSGTDKRRREFRDSVTIKTKTVDASPFVSMTPEVAGTARRTGGSA
jgi:hypothetical protein